MKNKVLKVENLSRKYEKFELKDVSFALPKGFIMGLIGENGAGKTTIIKLLLNMIKRDSGKVAIFGKDNIKEEILIKKEIGTIFDSNIFMEDWKIAEVEKSMSMFYPNWDHTKFHHLLQQFSLQKDKKVGELSKGMQTKLMVACALSYDAKLLILDEPTSGLDPVSRDQFLEVLLDYIEDREHSILFSTHITIDLDKIADYITYLHKGRVIYTGDKTEFVESFRIIKGGRSELFPELEKKLIGVRKFATGFEGLIRTQEARNYPELLLEPATMDEIMVYTSKGGKNDE